MPYVRASLKQEEYHIYMAQLSLESLERLKLLALF